MTDDERLPGFPGHPRSRASLGIADLLEDGPKSVDELAQDTRAHAPALYRLLRALAGVGVFAEEDDGRFVLTPTAEYLGIDGPVSVRAWAQFVGQPYTWSAWAHLLDSIRTGEAAYDGTEPPANSEGNASSAAKVLPATGGVLPIAGLTGLVIVAGGLLMRRFAR